MNIVFIITTLGLAVLSSSLCVKLKRVNAERKALSEKLLSVQSQLEELQPKTIEDAAEDEIDYFKSKKDKLMFLLLEVDGKRRNQLLGITPNMYDDSQAAKKWYKSLSIHVHPDKNPGDEDAAKAFDKLKELHTMMTI